MPYQRSQGRAAEGDASETAPISFVCNPTPILTPARERALAAAALKGTGNADYGMPVKRCFRSKCAFCLAACGLFLNRTVQLRREGGRCRVCGGEGGTLSLQNLRGPAFRAPPEPFGGELEIDFGIEAAASAAGRKFALPCPRKRESMQARNAGLACACPGLPLSLERRRSCMRPHREATLAQTFAPKRKIAPKPP